MVARCAVLNVGASLPIRTFNENLTERSLSSHRLLHSLACLEGHNLSTFAEVFGNNPLVCH
jgi:hypothetical protein